MKAGDLYIHRHQSIWNAFNRLNENRIPIDLLTVSEELDRMGQLADIGGSAYLTGLINQVLSSLNAEAYGRIIQTYSTRRKIIRAAGRMAQLAYDESIELDELTGRCVSDLEQADFSVMVFAHTMLANCEQAGQVVKNYTRETPGEVASFDDLWKFTLVNYNAGGGCLAEGISHAWGERTEPEEPITWDDVSPFLTGACIGAVDYVNDISQ